MGITCASAAAPLPAGAGPPQHARLQRRRAEPRARGRVSGTRSSSATRPRPTPGCGPPAPRPRPRRASPADVKPSRRHSVSISCCMSMRVSVQRAQRLVQQQQARPVHQRPRQRDPLTLPARQLRRPVAAPVAQTDLAQHRRGLRPLPARQAQRHVVQHRLPRQQPCVLEHDADPVVGAPLRKPVEQHRRARAGGPPCSPLGASSPASRRSSVLLPQPLRPTTATNSPAASSRSRPRSTTRSP